MQQVFYDKSVQKVPIKAWIEGVPFEEDAKTQLINTSTLPFIHKNGIAVMPDVHLGKGSTIGSVIPTIGAIIPAAVGVDIGCGMVACKTTLKAEDLPDDLNPIRTSIEESVPHGRSDDGGRNDKGRHQKELPTVVKESFKDLEIELKVITEKANSQSLTKQSERCSGHLGTLGTGNHFIELCIDENNDVWIMLHSGSRGIGNSIGTHYINLAKEEMRKFFINLPDKDLAYLPEGSTYFSDYIKAVNWAQRFASKNRECMMHLVIEAIRKHINKPFDVNVEAINCHHNYVSKERHFGDDIFVTRKGAVSAKEGELGIIPGSMGTKSYIVRGKGNKESYCSCSHGAGRRMGRNEAKRQFSLIDMELTTKGVECRKDDSVLDEIPLAYKDIDAVMEAQKDLVDIVHTLKQVLCVKG